MSVIVFAMDQLAKVYSLLAGWFILLLALCAVMAVIGQNWVGLGKMYSAGGEFTENIDKAAGTGTAIFAAKAIEIYCK